MAETVCRVCAGLLNVSATGETVIYICAGIPNAYSEEAPSVVVPIMMYHYMNH